MLAAKPEILTRPPILASSYDALPFMAEWSFLAIIHSYTI
jgi:hypothetical protein